MKAWHVTAITGISLIHLTSTSQKLIEMLIA